MDKKFNRLIDRLAKLETELDELKNSIHYVSNLKQIGLLTSRMKAINAIINLHHKTNESWNYTDPDYKIYSYSENKRNLRLFVELGKRHTCTLVYKVFNNRLVSAKFNSHLGHVVEDLKAKLKDSQYSNLYR